MIVKPLLCCPSTPHAWCKAHEYVCGGPVLAVGTQQLDNVENVWKQMTMNTCTRSMWNPPELLDGQDQGIRPEAAFRASIPTESDVLGPRLPWGVADPAPAARPSHMARYGQIWPVILQPMLLAHWAACPLLGVSCSVVIAEERLCRFCIARYWKNGLGLSWFSMFKHVQTLHIRNLFKLAALMANLATEVSSFCCDELEF